MTHSDTPQVSTRRETTRWRLWLSWVAVVLALGGWWISLDLWLIGSNQSATNPLLGAWCGGAAAGDCLSILRSKWGSVRVFNVPISTSALGMGYFAFVAMWYLFVGPPARSGRWWHLIIAATVLIGVVQSIGLMRVMVIELGRICPGCLAVHMINALLAAVTVAVFPWRRTAREAADSLSPRLALATFSGCLLVFLLHVTIAVLAYMGQGAGQLQSAYRKIVEDPAYVRWAYENRTTVAIPIRDDEAIAGDPEAPNTVVAFVDFQCPQCRLAYNELSDVVRRYPHQVRVVYRHFPQDSACNETFERREHPLACAAAAAAEAARILGGDETYARMRSIMYRSQAGLSPNRFAGWAEDLDLDPARFGETMQSDAVAERIAEDVALGRSLDIRAVPVLYLNGKQLVGWHLPATWEALLNPKRPSAADEKSDSAERDAAP